MIKQADVNDITVVETYIGCSIIIYNSENRVLIARRSKSKKKFPLMWETVGGALENNETPDDCIRREVMEELNCTINNLKLFNVYVINEDNRYVLIVYTGKLNGKVQQNSEIDQVRWIDRSEVEQFDFCGNEINKLLDYFKSHS
ncbi:NUDIX domain-containing protein [Clostridium sp.]|uniref:NUDIX hydrolase n=1 Tax=Clostridium sp. TaxID=1506 RepID=UPI002604AF7A|nr:NUDIX domain-containing protein [Clostridium sp.]